MGDEVFPVLATIILVATLITLIVAIASYIVFRVKEKRRAEAAALAPQEIVPEMLDDPTSSAPHFRKSDFGKNGDRRDPNNPEGNRTIGRRMADSKEGSSYDRRGSAVSSGNQPKRRTSEKAQEEKTNALTTDASQSKDHMMEFDDEDDSSRAKSAFMKSMRNGSGIEMDEDSHRPLQLKKFSTHKREKSVQKEIGPKNEGAKWN